MAIRAATLNRCIVMSSARFIATAFAVAMLAFTPAQAQSARLDGDAPESSGHGPSAPAAAEPPQNGTLCTDSMQTEPDEDDLDPLRILFRQAGKSPRRAFGLVVSLDQSGCEDYALRAVST